MAFYLFYVPSLFLCKALTEPCSFPPPHCSPPLRFIFLYHNNDRISAAWCIPLSAVRGQIRPSGETSEDSSTHHIVGEKHDVCVQELFYFISNSDEQNVRQRPEHLHLATWTLFSNYCANYYCLSPQKCDDYKTSCSLILI